MKILLALRGSNIGKKPYCGFKSEYNNILIDPLYAGTFGWYWIKALKQLGHTVETAAIRRSYVELDRSILSPYYDIIRRKLGLNRLAEQLAADILITKAKQFKPDLILVDGGYTLTAKTIMLLKEKRYTLVNWLFDEPFHQGWQNVIDSFPYYDLIVTFDPFYIQKYIDHGAKFVIYLPLAFDPDIFNKINLYKKQIDISFVGAITRSRIEMLPTLSGFNINIWTWNRRALPDCLRQFYKGKAYGEHVNLIYNFSKIALNFHHPQSILGTNMRTFEIAGSGTFQLVDYKKELENLFEPEKELIFYKNIDELPELIRHYLFYESEREKIAQATMKRAKNEHTYIHRFIKMLSYF